MIKYHFEVYFPQYIINDGQNLLKKLKEYPLKFSHHSINELLKEYQAEKIIQRLKEYQLNFNDIFEIAVLNNKIEKMGFRISFENKDIIFILSKNNIIITLWTNFKNDKHFTLNKNNYARA